MAEIGKIKAKCVDVIDGDTIFVRWGSIGFEVRVWGCNAYERNTKQGKIAKDYTEQAILNQKVRLGLHEGQQDGYGRKTLQVWYGKDFEFDLAQSLIKAELATPLIFEVSKLLATDD